MAIMTHTKFHFNWLMLTLIFGIWASEPPRAWRTTEKAGPDRVKSDKHGEEVDWDIRGLFLDRCLINVENDTNGKDFKHLDSFLVLVTNTAIIYWHNYDHTRYISGCTGRVEQYYFDSVVK